MSPPSGSNLWLSSVTLTLNRYGRNMGSAHRLYGVNIWHKFHENPSSRFRDMETSNLWPWTGMVGTLVLHIAFMRWTSDTSFMKILQAVSEIWSGHDQTFDLQAWPWPWTGMVGTRVLHIAFVRWTSDTSFMKIPQAVSEIWSGHDQTFDLQAWPWPWTGMIGTQVLHIASLGWTCDTSLMKIPQVVSEIWSGHEKQAQTYDLQAWPWPWTGMVGTWVLHVASVRWTCDTSLMKIPQAVSEIWSGHEKQAQTYDLQAWPWPWTGMVGTWVLHVASVRWTCDTSLMKIPQAVSEIWSGHEKQAQTYDLQAWPWPWTGMVGTWVLHVASVRWTCDTSLMKIPQAVSEIWSGHDFMDRRTDGQTDIRHKNNISPLYTGGDIINPKIWKI